MSTPLRLNFLRSVVQHGGPRRNIRARYMLVCFFARVRPMVPGPVPTSEGCLSPCFSQSAPGLLL